NEEIYKELCIVSLHGQNKDALAKTQKGNWRYDVITAGYKCNMTDICAAIGLIEIDRYKDDTLVKRKQIFDKYAQKLADYSWAELPVYQSDEKTSSYHLFPLRIKGVTEEQRDAIIQKIFDKDVSVNVHFIPVPKMSFYASLGYDMKNYPVAMDNYSREISLPVYYDLSDENIKTVINAVIDAVETILEKTEV
ncbi:MAG: DegT/DnrJ/EryC1/StrS family aminotransferase, partial [Bacteroidota bacterium]|nr:DegT/DnrJ/EryC1/StrS family aminotransferase [Bacteroidota bacterium]